MMLMLILIDGYLGDTEQSTYGDHKLTFDHKLVHMMDTDHHNTEGEEKENRTQAVKEERQRNGKRDRGQK